MSELLSTLLLTHGLRLIPSLRQARLPNSYKSFLKLVLSPYLSITPAASFSFLPPSSPLFNQTITSCDPYKNLRTSIFVNDFHFSIFSFFSGRFYLQTKRSRIVLVSDRCFYILLSFTPSFTLFEDLHPTLAFLHPHLTSISHQTFLFPSETINATIVFESSMLINSCDKNR